MPALNFAFFCGHVVASSVWSDLLRCSVCSTELMRQAGGAPSTLGKFGATVVVPWDSMVYLCKQLVSSVVFRAFLFCGNVVASSVWPELFRFSVCSTQLMRQEGRRSTQDKFVMIVMVPSVGTVPLCEMVYLCK